MEKINCKYYCEDYLLKGMCKLYSDWNDPMAPVAYCIGERCKEMEPIIEPTYTKNKNEEI